MEFLAIFALFLNLYSSVAAFQIFFEHQLAFDGYMCSVTEYLGKKRSIYECSSVCVRETSCVGFFFNYLNNDCSATSQVYAVPGECMWTGDDTNYYIDGKLSIVN